MSSVIFNRQGAGFGDLSATIPLPGGRSVNVIHAYDSIGLVVAGAKSSAAVTLTEPEARLLLQLLEAFITIAQEWMLGKDQEAVTPSVPTPDTPRNFTDGERLSDDLPVSAVFARMPPL
jgi:hypothetical protein